jgi:hypothetical protein
MMWTAPRGCLAVALLRLRKTLLMLGALEIRPFSGSEKMGTICRSLVCPSGCASRAGLFQCIALALVDLDVTVASRCDNPWWPLLRGHLLNLRQGRFPPPQSRKFICSVGPDFKICSVVNGRNVTPRTTSAQLL